MAWIKNADGSEICYGGDIATYQAAIQAAPPGTLIKMGDLEPKDMVRCSTCDSQMERKAAEFHKHPKRCGTCKDSFDENMVRHEPIHRTKSGGAGIITFTRGCRVVAL